ncbi:hypothetical protein KAR91_39435, partial [Candidatus Pacearchaeota archaeon]|nr:hypothetical protein [Candidatus Pacearchaeota archaeon]
MPTVKTTKKDYELFRKEAMKWMQFWGLYDWEISFDFKHAENADATARWSYNDHWAVLTLSDELND